MSTGLQDFVAVYDAEPQLRNPRRFFRAMVVDVSGARHLIWRLLLQNLRSHYRQSALGYVWLLITPVSTAVVWIFLRRSGIVSFAETDVPYPVFVTCGIFLWQAFLRMLNSPLQQLSASRYFLTKIRFPWEAVLLAAWGEVLFEFVVYLVILAFVFAAFGVPFFGGLVLALPPMAALLLLGATTGMLLAPLGLLYGDVARAIGVGTFFLFFLTPIIYPAPSEMPGALTVVANPVAVLLVTSRELLTSAPVSHQGLFVVYTVGTVVLFALAWILFRLAEPHLVTRL